MRKKCISFSSLYPKHGDTTAFLVSRSVFEHSQGEIFFVISDQNSSSCNFWSMGILKESPAQLSL